MIFPRAALTALALTMIAPAAWAQTPPPAAPEALPSPPAALPAAVQAPPAGYAPPPAGYAPPPAGYAPPPAGYASSLGYWSPAFSLPPRQPLGPETLEYKDGYPIPYGYHPKTRYRTGLLIGGGVTFGVTYAFSLFVAAASSEAVLALPVVGPFIEAGRFASMKGDGFHGLAAAIMAVDGVAQTAGAVMLVVGLTQKKQVLVRDEVTGGTVRVTPMTMGYGGMGIGLVGTM